MTVQSALAPKCNNGTPNAFRLVGASPSEIATLTATDEGASSAPYRQSNRMIKFFSGTGASKVLLVAWIYNTIQTFDGSTWTVRATFSGQFPQEHTGLHVVGVKSTDGVTWTTTVIATSINLSGLVFWELVFSNVLYLATTGVNYQGHFAWDPATNSFNRSSPADMQNGSNQDACVFNNALYKLAESASYGGYSIWALAAGTWTRVLTLPLPGNSAHDTQVASFGSAPMGCLLFDGGDGYLYAIYPSTHNGSAYGYAAAQISVNGLSGTATDLSSVVLPPNWLYASPATSGFLQFNSLSETDSNPGAPTATTTIAAGSNGQSLPQATINVASTSGFPTSGAIAVATSDGVQTVAYTGVTGTSFTGCTGGTGTMSLGGAVQSKAQPFIHIWMVTAYSNVPINYYTWNGPTAVIGNGGIPTDSGGDVSMVTPNSKSGGNDRIWVPSDYDVRVVSTLVLSGSQQINFMAGGPTGTEVKSFAQLFSTTLEDPSLYGTLSSPGVFGTTVAVGSNGVDLGSVVQPFTLNVASTVDLPTSGTVFVTSTAGPNQPVAYTGVTPTSFTGCTTTGTGVLATGNAVASGPSPAPTLDPSNRQLNNVTCDMNTATPTIYKAVWQSLADGIAKNSKVRTDQRVF
jgi:hypothetical protein